MSDESLQKQLEGRLVNGMKPSEAIRRGKEIIGDKESAMTFQLCALGCIWAAVYGHEMTPTEYRGLGFSGYEKLPFRIIARRLGLDVNTAAEISFIHSWGTPALTIAAELESRGL